MRRFLLLLCFSFLPPLAHAWNAAGHRLTAYIAWQQLSPASQAAIATILSHHPDYPRWQNKADSGNPADLFAEASTWPDDIRNDPRFVETDRHKNWHYVDLDTSGAAREGELDRQIERLSQLLDARAPEGIRSTGQNEQISIALSWLIHLVADIHQPLHVGRHGDEGGNRVEIENPFNPRLPFSNLHTYWDDLPGPPWLRGKRLEKNARRLLDTLPPPQAGNVAQWRSESHQLLAAAYPPTAGSLLPVITAEFQQTAREIANRRIVDGAYRLGWRLEAIFARRVSRETP